jgi:hypothetical protein
VGRARGGGASKGGRAGKGGGGAGREGEGGGQFFFKIIFVIKHF